MMDFTFSTTNRIIFGTGRVNGIGTESALLGRRALLVCGQGSLRRTGRLDEILRSLAAAGVCSTVYEDVPPEPTLADVQGGIHLFREKRCDLVLGIGGGSAIDVGKAIAVLAGAPGSVREYFGGRDPEEKGVPFIAVPTTAGSGAEVTPNAVLTDAESGVKASIRSRFMFPDVAIVDPDLTLSLPTDVTAFSGMDALCQAFEGFVSRGASPLTDSLAGDAAVRILLNLPRVYGDEQNLDLRSEVALGSLMAGMAFSNARLGLVHGLAHPVGIATGLRHGLVCGLLLPVVIRFNTPVSMAKYAWVARTAGIASADGSEVDASEALVAAIDRLNGELGLAEYNHAAAVPSGVWPKIVSQVLASGSTKSNPRTVTAHDVEEILAGLGR